MPSDVQSKGHQQSMKTKLTPTATFLLISLFCSGSLAQSSKTPTEPDRHDSLDARVKSETAAFKGKVSLFAKNLDTGETYALGEDDRVRTASTIKIAVM